MACGGSGAVAGGGVGGSTLAVARLGLELDRPGIDVAFHEELEHAVDEEPVVAPGGAYRLELAAGGPVGHRTGGDTEEPGHVPRRQHAFWETLLCASQV